MSIKAQDELRLDSQEPAQKIILPPLTAETIQRAKEGLAAARELSANRLVYQALMSSEAIALGRSDQKISGEQRRKLL